MFVSPFDSSKHLGVDLGGRSLREEGSWKRLRPLWSPQQRGRRNSFVGLPNLGINRVSRVLTSITCDYSIYCCGCSSCSSSLIGCGARSTFW